MIAAGCTLVGTLLQLDLHGIQGERLIANVRRETFAKYLSMHVGFFDSPLHIPAVIVSRLSIDARRVRDLMDRVATISENYILVVATLVLCLSPVGDWRLTLIALAVSPFCFGAVYMQFNFLTRITEQVDAELVKRSGDLTDYVLNIHTIHAYNLEPVLEDRLQKHLKAANALVDRRTWRASLGQGFSLFLPCVFHVTIFACGFLMMLKSQISFTQMLVVYMMTGTSFFTLGLNLSITPTMKLAQKSTNNIIAILDTPSQDDACREVKKEGANGDIVFDKVEFAYPTRPEAPILKGVSFTIPKNASVAFVGHSGCGKSTIISLIQRFYKPAAGTISLNGVEVNQLNLDWYRGLLGVVNQEPVMFSGTIRENLLMGVDRAVSEEELKSVCEQALCMDFINEMPDGFETDLGATGKAVSGGQKQRLALARAILRNPAILLLDEATSALDSENQEKFLEALNSWRKSHPCTVVTVAHRLSTIVDSDIIFVVDDGRIIDQGTHEALLKSCAFYANLVRGQLQSESCVCRTNPPTTNYIEPILGLSGTLGT